MRLLFLFLLLAAAGSQARAEPPASVPFPSILAEHFFQTVYRAFKGHKALVVGSYGAYSWSYRQPNVREAQRAALDYCRQILRRDYPKQAGNLQCEVLAIDSKLVKPDPWIGVPLQKPLAGMDMPLLVGVRVAHGAGSLRGVVLHVHGCNGLGDDALMRIWGRFFAVHGYDFFAPVSFADPRPAAACGSPDPNVTHPERMRDVSIVAKLRIAQTLRTIAELQRRYPGVPLYVWGHSEGGFVVQWLPQKVAGLIVTGEECGIGGMKIAAPKSTPVLYLFGDRDPFVDGFKKPLTEKAVQRCRNLARGKVTATVIAGAGHVYFPWRADIAAAILKFLGESYTAPLANSGPTYPMSPPAGKALESYRKQPKHRAFAVGPGGIYSWAGNWEYAADAEQYALYLCALQTGTDYFHMKQHPCAVIDVDGAPRTAK